MIRRESSVLDEYSRPITGATVYVYRQDGTPATLTSDGSSPLSQPVLTDEFGVYAYYADEDAYREDTWYGGKLRFREVVLIGNPAGDLLLRDDLAAASGADLVGTLGGSTLSALLAGTPRPLFFGWKSPARTLPDALRLIDTLPAKVVGYAAGTTGGYGGTRYLVSNKSSDGNQPNSFNDCYTRARLAGGSKVIHFDTRGHFDVFVPRSLYFDAATNNISIVAPGLNVTFWTDPLAATAAVTGQNMIFYGIEFRTLPGTLAAYDDASGTKSEKKLVAVDPTVCDRIAFINCEFRHSSDGCLDMSGAILAGQAQCRVSVINCIFWDSDQPMMLGSGDPLCTATDPAILKVTLYNNIFAYCAERKPKVLGRTHVHIVNLIDEFLPFRRDQLPPTNELSAAYGASAMFGGTMLIDSALWMSADGVTGRAATVIDSVANGASVMVDGAIQVINSATEDGITIQTGNTSRLPALPYTLNGTPVPALGAARNAWIANLWAICGARPTSAPRGLWIRTPATTESPNGDTVLRDRLLGGRLLRVDSPNEYKTLGDWPTTISGSFVPALTAVTNCSAPALVRANYQANNKRVTVSVVFDVVVTTGSASISVGIGLPVADDIGTTSDVSGSCRVVSATNQAAGYVNGDAVNDRAQATITPTSANGSTARISADFTYMLP